MKALTEQQARALDFIKSYQASRGITPSFDDIKDHLGLASKSGVFRIIEALVERGFIRRLRYKARCIEVVENPSFSLPSDVHGWALANIEVIRGLASGELFIARQVQ